MTLNERHVDNSSVIPLSIFTCDMTSYFKVTMDLQNVKLFRKNVINYTALLIIPVFMPE